MFVALLQHSVAAREAASLEVEAMPDCRSGALTLCVALFLDTGRNGKSLTVPPTPTTACVPHWALFGACFFPAQED